jgi:hypothetical protein
VHPFELDGQISQLVDDALLTLRNG